MIWQFFFFLQQFNHLHMEITSTSSLTDFSAIVLSLFFEISNTSSSSPHLWSNTVFPFKAFGR